MSRSFAIALVLTASVTLAADPQFVEVATSRNLVFEVEYGTVFASVTGGSEMMQRNMGNGMAVGDYDNDGDLDIYLLSQSGFTNQLFRNNLDLGSATFTDVTATAGVGNDGFSRTAAFVDLDNDGWKDLVLLNDHDGLTSFAQSTIYRNNTDGTFEDVGADSGFPAIGLIRGGMSFADYDADGLLDIYVSNWGREVGGGTPDLPGSNVLYRNLDGFRFEDANVSGHLDYLSRDSFQSIFHDLDDDIDPDIFVAIDHTSDEFYYNLGGGIFFNQTGAVGLTHTGNDMGTTCGDIDDDLDLDIYSTNITDPDLLFGTTQGNVLYVNQLDNMASLWFDDEATARGVKDTYWGWGVKFVDVENDGDLDIVAATGFDQFVFVAGIPGTPLLNSPMVLFLNDGSGNFTRDMGAGIGGSDDSRGLAAVDYDRDGDQDLIVTNIMEPTRLIENVSTNPGNWLNVRLVQAPGGNRDGIGATVFYTVGSLTRRREMIVSDSYLTGSPPEIHIGLGSANSVNQLTVRWTDGTQSVYDNVAANQEVVFSQASPDLDLDGIADGGDCAQSDPQLWTVPGAIQDLRVAKNGMGVQLDWSRPSQPGGWYLSYDVLRGASPGAGDAGCLQAGLSQRTATDGAPPAGLTYYLIRAENGCGGGVGASSTGPRTPPSCP